ncbi:MAG: hypothetical protein WBI34_10275, partial [Tenuifilaceae bacterium]
MKPVRLRLYLSRSIISKLHLRYSKITNPPVIGRILYVFTHGLTFCHAVSLPVSGLEGAGEEHCFTHFEYVMDKLTIIEKINIERILRAS